MPRGSRPPKKRKARFTGKDEVSVYSRKTGKLMAWESGRVAGENFALGADRTAGGSRRPMSAQRQSMMAKGRPESAGVARTARTAAKAARVKQSRQLSKKTPTKRKRKR